ncbi:porimin isoform X2 [Calypte anna]|uniref:porimin isoform X2 n=1 Tax=Calypte anna TaxID=9244 RepID=UPI0011C4A884|nr:porimin isoform X2 [Calypte anna]
MRLLTAASCALQAAALLLLARGSRNQEITNSSSTAPLTTIPGHKLQGVSNSATHLTGTNQPTNTTVTLTTQPTKTSQTANSTTASSVTSSQLNITVVTTSKTSFSSVTAPSKSEAVITKTSRFDVGSFVGGIVLTLGSLVILYIGCKTYHSRRGIQYRTIDEHDAII